ncbi:hypothetical protein [Clostridium beijerinckii]|uniref:hypothetical protein n=1 Tax=Clostridium beijerinckii TaxID=1520 RepID=UPI00098CDB48|nr:hypothetical protein [Clostridium beijerinckii]MBA8937755.1 hypothetical protein [Clostridium beijerinckii]NRU41629.1 hypothetical protein [Clostridium beijerinckii]NSB00827.1 hypothetical protein [Clostridium beijerinckii]OOM52629.1 hypothetical protein CLOBI_53240 [Clostridium beijerinckii]OOM65604.1 hypothetical protein CLBEIC_50900 [Clostridium beijerinckii]
MPKKVNKHPEFNLQKSISKGGKKYNVGVGKDDDGYFVHTHRARSKSYKNKSDIPIKDLKFIESTG